MSADRTFPLESHAGGSCREWIDYLHRELGDPLCEASEPMRRMVRIYLRENRAERLVNRLVALERAAQSDLVRERGERQALEREIAFNRRMLDDRDRQYAALKSECAALQRRWSWRTLRGVRRVLMKFRGSARPVRPVGNTGRVAG